MRELKDGSQIADDAGAKASASAIPDIEPTPIVGSSSAVDSTAFKDWFGDWEHESQREFLESEPVVKLQGDEFKKSNDQQRLTKRVGDWFKSEHDNKAIHPVIGEVTIDERSAKDSLSHGIGRTKAAAFAAIPGIVSHGAILSSTSDRKGHNTKEHILAAPIEIGGVHHVGVGAVRGDANGQRFYLHEAVETKKLQSSFKTRASAEAGERTGEPGAINKLLQSVFAVNENPTSKIVGKDGKPLKVFHGTDRSVEQFDVFGGNDFGSHFGTAEQANDRASRSDGQVIPAYLSAKNPLRLPDLERWDYSTMQPELAKHGIDVPKVEYRIETADRSENYGRMIRRENEAIGQAITKAGYDSIVYRNSYEGQDQEPADSHIVWNPTQIKSTFNRGTWSKDDPRIGFAAGGKPRIGNNVAAHIEHDDGIMLEDALPLIGDDAEQPARPSRKSPLFDVAEALGSIVPPALWFTGQNAGNAPPPPIKSPRGKSLWAVMAGGNGARTPASPDQTRSRPVKPGRTRRTRRPRRPRGTDGVCQHRQSCPPNPHQPDQSSGRNRHNRRSHRQTRPMDSTAGLDRRTLEADADTGTRTGGDPRFLDQPRKALADIRKIWGADAPLRIQHEGELRVAGKTQEQADAELVKHVQGLLEQMQK